MANTGPGATLQRQKPFYSESHGFPATCNLVAEFTAPDGTKRFLIWGTGDPGTDYTNAPVGSIYINETQGSSHVKTANPNTWGDSGP